MLYGESGGLIPTSRRLLGGGVWSRIVGSITQLHETQTVADGSIRRVLGNGERTMFWRDVWCGDGRLDVRFPRIFALSSVPDALVRDLRVDDGWNFRWHRLIRGGEEDSQLRNLMVVLDSVSLSHTPDRWTWDLDHSGEFSVRFLRQHLDGIRLPVVAQPTRWNRAVPIKINVFLWRVMLNRLSCRSQLVLRGIDVESVLCPCCQEEEETVSHLFFGCIIARQVWSRMESWIQMDIPQFHSPIELVNWVDSHPVGRLVRSKVESICMVVIWVLWTYRNALVFNPEKAKKQFIFDSIRDLSFNWFVSRNHKVKMFWVDWLQNPVLM